MNAIAMWYRDFPEESQVKSISAGTVKLRLPIHIDANGTMRLLH